MMMDTCFAPPQRADLQTLAGQIDAVNHNPAEFKPVLDRATPGQLIQEIQKTIIRHPAAVSRHLLFPEPLSDIIFTTSLNRPS
ncbi:MAG: hypothetical protein Q7U02_12245 [Desulfosalsimonadaceae bacterium]|nr:hypothetical protein [Desulfosalsimonadaceae bacterium]